jgi:hypothetical protein
LLFYGNIAKKKQNIYKKAGYHDLLQAVNLRLTCHTQTASSVLCLAG